MEIGAVTHVMPQSPRSIAPPPSVIRAAALGECMQSGSVSIYRGSDGRLSRVFAKGRSLETIVRELECNEQVRRAGIPAALVVAGPLQLDDGRFALTYAPSNGVPASRVAKSHPVSAYQRIAAVHFRIHGYGAMAQAPSLHRSLAERILAVSALTLRQRQAMLLRLESLPQGTVVCHGNFNLGDVLFVDSGEDLVSGWRNFAAGNRWSDVARTMLMLRHAEFVGSAPVRWMDSLRRRWRTRVYIDAYLARCDAATRRDGQAQLPEWLRVNAAARLTEVLGPHQASALLCVAAA